MDAQCELLSNVRLNEAALGICLVPSLFPRTSKGPVVLRLLLPCCLILIVRIFFFHQELHMARTAYFTEPGMVCSRTVAISSLNFAASPRCIT